VTATDIHRTIDTVWRIEAAKLIAGIARMVRDVGSPKTSHRMLWSRLLSSGPNRAFRTILARG
jgi:predicted RNA polymerase sigma factor